MKGKIVYHYVLMICICICLIGVGVSNGFDINSDDKGPAEIVLNADGKKPANFDHLSHQFSVGGCVPCHDPDMMDIKLMVTDKEYAHKKGCGSCHMKVKGLKKLKCKDCHPRKRVMVEGC